MFSELNPRTRHYEFFGPPGAFLISIGIPAVTYGLYFGCSEVTGGCPPQVNTDRIIHALTDASWWRSLWDTQAATAYFAWYAFCVVAWAIIPGDLVTGSKLRDGSQKVYKINAFSTFLLTLGATTGYIMRYGPESFTFIYHKWVGIVTAAMLMSVMQATYFYARSFKSGALLALGGNSGNVLYDWYIGRELNPSIGSLEFKSFNELRPGLILWVLTNISMVCEQAVRRGGFKNVTDSMWLVLAFHSWYVADGLYNEPALFTTMDIVTDGFGFMLAVGDLVVVPFTYTVQSRYLAFHPVELGPFWTLAILAFNFTGYYIFRSSNGEKNNFRNGTNPKNLTFMETKRGTKLLTSGWWGRSRHPNYFGDWIMGISWCLPTGANTPITYYYAAYFAVLLIHRQLRDEEACQEKYGDDWKRYKKLVPYRIIPYIY